MTKIKTVLITGGAGFIGSHLCSFLIKKNFRVIVIDNLIYGRKKNIEKKVTNQLKTYMYQLHILIYKHENRKRKLESELYNKKLELIKIMKKQIINITLLSGNNYNIYNSLYDFIQDLKNTFSNEKKYAILYKDVRINILSIEFLNSIDKIETINLQLIILNNEIETIDLPLINVKKRS